MKICLSGFLMLILCCFSFSPSVLAAFDLPGDYYLASDWKMAVAQAQSDHLPIAFLLSDRYTTCPLCSAASKDVLNALEGHAVIVYVESTDLPVLPPLVAKAINSPESGKLIPITAITDSECGRVLVVIPYIRDPGQRMAEITKAVAELPH